MSGRTRRRHRVWRRPNPTELMPRDRDWLSVRRALDDSRASGDADADGPASRCGGSDCIQLSPLPHVRVTATPV